MCILTTQLGRVIIFVIFRIFQKIYCKKKTTPVLIEFKNASRFLPLPWGYTDP